MRAFSFRVLLASLAGFAMTALQYVSVSLDYPEGMLNPDIEIHVDGDGKAYLMDWLLGLGLIGYIHLLVERTQTRLDQLQDALAAHAHGAHRNPPTPAQRLMEAVRLADIEAVRQLANADTLRGAGDSTLTPFELADIYGNQQIIDELSKAYAASLPRMSQGESMAPPVNRFALHPMPSRRASRLPHGRYGNTPVG